MQYGPKIVTNGLILHLDAADRTSYSGSGSVWRDLSGNSRLGTLTNFGAQTTFNNSNGGSIIFDGVNDCVVVDSNALFLPSSAYTKTAWIYVTSFSTGNNIISGGNVAQHAFFMQTANRLYAGHNGNWSTITSNSTLSLNIWYYATVTFNTTTGWVLYLNGIQDNTNSNTSTFSGNGEALVGAYGTGLNVFTGRIACASVYNRALSASEVRQNFNATRGRFGI